MRSPTKVSSVWPEMPFMRGPKGAERLREWQRTHRAIRAHTAARRERVLRHDWACVRLCHILGLSAAKKWNGYVPPAVDCHARIDHNPIRAALIQLLHDVARAEEGEVAPE